MINLVRNELKKIFHKKAIYVILFIAIGFMILNIVLTKYFENNMVFERSQSDVEFYSGMLNELDNLTKIINSQRQKNLTNISENISLNKKGNILKNLKLNTDVLDNIISAKEHSKIISNLKKSLPISKPIITKSKTRRYRYILDRILLFCLCFETYATSNNGKKNAAPIVNAIFDNVNILYLLIFLY